jgi:hypothetical protein
MAELPEPMEQPVALRGTMTETGWRPENARWRDHLMGIDEDGYLAGKDPMTIPVEILQAAGHPPRTAKAVFSAWGGCLADNPPKGAKGVRQHCLECSSSIAEVRRCRIYNCPAWPYRMGHSPHDSRRGKIPVFGTIPAQNPPY